jgi:hypothetical protein
MTQVERIAMSEPFYSALPSTVAPRRQLHCLSVTIVGTFAESFLLFCFDQPT